MLLESIEYPIDLPYSVSFSNVAEEDFHYHNELEILLILKGKTNCKIHNVHYSLKKGDVLIVDTKDMHRIFGSTPDIIMLDMYVDLEFYNDLYPDIDYMIFACEDYSKTSTLKYQDLQKKVSVLKHHIAKAALAYIREKENASLPMDCINDLIFTLVNQFQGFFIEDNKFKADRGGQSDIDFSRLYKIIKYIYLNYDKRITLEDLADIVYLSPYYISHLIKNTSGLSFQNFLNYVRLEYAEKLLVEDRLTLTQISESCGFSSLPYFNKCFRAWYNMTPAQYRKQLNPCERCSHGPFSKEMAVSLLETYIIARRSKMDDRLLSKSSHHIFIPVKYNYRTGKLFKKTFPLKILLSSYEDIFILNYQKERLQRLDSFIVELDCRLLCENRSKQEAMDILIALQSLKLPLQIACTEQAPDELTENMIKALNIPLISSEPSEAGTYYDPGAIYSVSSALSNIVKNPHDGVKLSGQFKALFTPEGLITPFYSVYSVFSGIDGVITELRDQYIIVKNEGTIYVMVFNEDRESKLKAHIHIKDIWGKRLIIEKTYGEKHNFHDSQKALGFPRILTDSMKAYINDASSGSISFSFTEAKETMDLDFEMDPNTFTYIEIRN